MVRDCHQLGMLVISMRLWHVSIAVAVASKQLPPFLLLIKDWQFPQ